ncbi:uncharacterized protein [Haliotis asinina]|uniref:uncharacterized protein n=1 Tax=Haliotis asinina TaxID=109174 RepID=UPI00353193F2
MKATSCVLTLTLLVSLTTSAPTQPPPRSGGDMVVSMTTSPVAPSGTFTSTPPSAPPPTPPVSTSGGGASVFRTYSSAPETTVPDTPVSSENSVSPSSVNDVKTIVVSFADSTTSPGSSLTSSLSGSSDVKNLTSVNMTTTTSGSTARSPTTEINAAGDYVPFSFPVEVDLIADENLLGSKSETVL